MSKTTVPGNQASVKAVKAKKDKPTCGVCGRDPERMNGEFSECSHLECPHRRHAWSERTWHASKGPWPKSIDADPVPLDIVFKGGA
jgi:hypothetical protein